MRIIIAATCMALLSTLAWAQAPSTAQAKPSDKPKTEAAAVTDEAKSTENPKPATSQPLATPLAPAPVIDVEAIKAEIRRELREEMKEEVKRAAQEAALGEKAQSVWKEESWIEEIKPELNFLEFDGYLRTRMDLFQRLHLGTYDAIAPVNGSDPTQGTRIRATSSVPPPTLFRADSDKTDTLTSANMRLRLQPILNISEDISIHATVDMFDNLVLGSTPEALPGFSGNPTLPLPAFSSSMSAPVYGFNSVSDSLVVKRLWAEVMTPFGQLRFGRVPSHFGLGLLANDGNKLDSDNGDSADRIMFVTQLYGHYIVPAWDFTSTGPSGRFGGDGSIDGTKNEGGQAYDLDPRDDVKSWILAVARKDKPADIEEKLANDDFVINYGAYFVYRTQAYDQPQWYMSPSFPYGESPSADPSMYVARNANAFILSTWGLFQWRKLKLEAEVVGLYGMIENIATAKYTGSGNDRTVLNTHDVYGVPVTAGQFGFALESSYAFLHDSLIVGLNAGMASGDDAPGFGLRPASAGSTDPKNGDFDGRQYGSCLTTNADGTCKDYDTTINNYRFDPDYHVDMILFREVLGTVTDAIYVKPHLTYYITEGLGVRGEVIQSFAFYATSTPGNSNLLGTELNAHLFYTSTDGFYAGISYGILFPWQALSHREGIALSDEAFREAKFAQTVQGMFGVMF